MSNEIKNKVEAILFASGNKISIEELSKLTGLSQKLIAETLGQLKEEYEQKDHSLKILDEGELWKMSVKEKYMPIVRCIVTETELQKSVLETLAVIAWKAPILQSDIIKLRNNKAYEHIGELIESGFINKERVGRSYKIKLAQKFFDYFDIENVKKLRKDLDTRADSASQTKEENLKKEAVQFPTEENAVTNIDINKAKQKEAELNQAVESIQSELNPKPEDIDDSKKDIKTQEE